LGMNAMEKTGVPRSKANSPAIVQFVVSQIFSVSPGNREPALTASHRPSGLKTTRFAAPFHSDASRLRLCKSQRFTELSEAVLSQRLSGLTAIALTGAWPERRRACWPVVRSQILIASPSYEPAARRLPSGEKARASSA